MDIPKIHVEFKLDANGKPICITRGDKNHYKLVLSVVGVPEDTHAVTYQLHESYYDPTREVRRGEAGFPEEITSYGDYAIAARVRQKSSSTVVKTILTKALSDTYKDAGNEEIQRAISELQQY